MTRRIFQPYVRSGAAALRLLTTAIPPGVLAALVSTRAALTIVGALSVALLPPGHPTVLAPATGITLLDVWTRWDGPFYVEIAASGYSAQPPLPNIVFFPLYPALIRMIAAIVGGGSLALWVAALGISLVSLATAVGYLIALARIDFGDQVARRAATYLVVFPTSLFLSATYPESLFLALSLASYYYARRGRWWLVGLLGLAASLARPYGALLAIPLAFEYLLQRKFDLRRVRPGCLWIGLVPLGLPIFLAYIAWKFQDPGAMGAAQDIWGRGLVAPWDVMARYFEGPVVWHGLTGGEITCRPEFRRVLRGPGHRGVVALAAHICHSFDPAPGRVPELWQLHLRAALRTGHLSGIHLAGLMDRRWSAA